MCVRASLCVYVYGANLGLGGGGGVPRCPDPPPLKFERSPFYLGCLGFFTNLFRETARESDRETETERQTESFYSTLLYIGCTVLY